MTQMQEFFLTEFIFDVQTSSMEGLIPLFFQKISKVTFFAYWSLVLNLIFTTIMAADSSDDAGNNTFDHINSGCVCKKQILFQICVVFIVKNWIRFYCNFSWSYLNSYWSKWSQICVELNLLYSSQEQKDQKLLSFWNRLNSVGVDQYSLKTWSISWLNGSQVLPGCI